MPLITRSNYPRFTLAINTRFSLPHNPYKKYIYGNDTVYIWFIYVFINSVLKFRIFNKDLIFCDFIKTRCVCNLYGIFKPYMQIIRFAYVIYKPYIFYIRYIKYCKLQSVTFFEDILIKFCDNLFYFDKL